jgi:tetratricopeptide (TPR) repeat protein
MFGGSPWPCDFGPELSRGFRALKTWVTLKAFGTDALGAVIDHTCELARHLESRVAAAPELELLAPVELNIVCFRFRFEGASEEALNQLNREIVIKLQEAGAVAPSTTIIAGRLAIRAAIVNHRTTRADVDTLVESVLIAGRTITGTSDHAGANGKDWQPWLQRNSRLHGIDVQLSAGDLQKEKEVALRFERALLLNMQGRPLEARNEHLKVIELDPAHQQNLNALGLLLVAMQKKKAALLVFAEAVRQAPESIISRVNYGGVLLEENDNFTAREQFEAALRVDPKFSNAHAGLYYALARLGELEAAEVHRRLGFERKSVFKNPYRGTAQPIPVILLVSSTGGNTPIEKLLDDSIFETHVVVADFFDLKDPLPEHRLIVNGIGDVDVSQEALIAAEALLAHSSAPVLNHPAAVRATGRCENAARLRDLPGVVAPATQMFAYSLLASADGAPALVEHGFTFPILLRVPGFHMGEHFVDVQSAEALADAVAGLPGAGRSNAQLLAIQYLDARGSDGSFRKYRVMMIDGQLYPLHLAIAPQWKIHYFSADMADKPDHRGEEAEFLGNMPHFLGPKAMHALEQVQAALGLDYAGVDFGLGPNGEVLLFEANATMVVQHPDPGEHWDYRRPAVDRIHAAVRNMLLKRAGHALVTNDNSHAAALGAF